MTAAEADFQPRRGKARLRLGIPADLLTLHGRTRVTLLDLSETGARLRYDGEGISDGVLEWLDHEAFGAVVRQTGDEVGLRFDEPIEQDCVLETRERLPLIASSEDSLMRFAREWVRGEDRQRASRRKLGLGLLASAANGLRRKRRRPTTLRGWLHAAPPFMLGGVAVGIVAGYGSSFF